MNMDLWYSVISIYKWEPWNLSLNVQKERIYKYMSVVCFTRITHVLEVKHFIQ